MDHLNGMSMHENKLALKKSFGSITIYQSINRFNLLEAAIVKQHYIRKLSIEISCTSWDNGKNGNSGSL